MRVVFMGTPDFAVATLDAVVSAGHEVVCVVAQPDRKKGRGKKLQSPPTIVRARELGLRTWQPKAVRSGPFVEWFTTEMDADVAVVVAYGRILIDRLLQAPKRGCINVHASLLPKYRGAAPIQWALIEGEAETGICTMQMDVGLDTGDVLLRRSTPIDPDETGPELWSRLAALGAETLVHTLAQLDTLQAREQDHERHTLAPLLTKADGALDFSRPAREVHNRVRGVNPWPCGQARFRGQTVRIHRTRVVHDDGTHGEPGTIIEAGKRLVVACGRGSLEVLTGQLAGKPRRAGRELVNGARIVPGEVFSQLAVEAS
ncbi:MAG: methionyl-tRNA formyltransferase [Deltaproteobacteria bacterium]|nr:methionyl-tRNA formyltransferase [Deltaproteobacteria bacterium]HCH63466.1 methionyl-tRNA formyltransferase [Deltaproteobacteria bacterium]